VNSGSAGKTDGFELPAEVTLRQNYPNPFNPATVLEFGIPSSTEVTVSVYDILGNEVSRLVSDRVEAGWHSVTFEASSLSSGTYLVVLRTPEKIETNQILLVK
jgi:hypothetical protein